MINKLSVIVSVYNEEDSLKLFYNEASMVLKNSPFDYELIFVNDGSTDNSIGILKSLAQSNSNVHIISFSRNFGHEAAMIAGIDYSSGDGVICMDADLQHPPKKIPEIVDKFNEGYDVISMVRTQNKDAGFIKKLTSFLFYKFLNFLSPVKFEQNSSDFFAFSRKVSDVLKRQYREKVRYLRGFVQSLGFKKTTIEFEAEKRIAGESKYSIKKLIKFSLNVLCSFSDLPLKLGIWSGCIVGLFGMIVMVYSLIMKFVYGAPSGYTTIIVVLCFLFAVMLFVVGIIGQYISVVFTELKNRPIYIIDEVINVTMEK